MKSMIIPESDSEIYEISALLDSNGNYYVIRTKKYDGHGVLLMKISTVTFQLQSIYISTYMFTGMVISERNNLIIVHGNRFIQAFDLDSLKSVWTTQLTDESLISTSDIILVENEFKDGIDIVYCSYTSSIFRVKARDGTILSSVNVKNEFVEEYLMGISYSGIPGVIAIQFDSYLMNVEMTTKTLGPRIRLSALTDCSPLMTKTTPSQLAEIHFETVFSCSNISHYLHWTFGSNYLLSYETMAHNIGGGRIAFEPPKLKYVLDLGQDNLSNVPLVSLDSSHMSIFVSSNSKQYPQPFKYDLSTNSISQVKLSNNDGGMYGTKMMTFSALNSRIYVCGSLEDHKVHCHSSLLLK